MQCDVGVQKEFKELSENLVKKRWCWTAMQKMSESWLGKHGKKIGISGKGKLAGWNIKYKLKIEFKKNLIKAQWAKGKL